MMDPLPTLLKVFSLVVQEERQCTNCMDQFPVFDSMVNAMVRSGFNSSNPIKQDHRDRYFCTHCKLNGHSKERCYKLIGYPPSYKAISGQSLSNSDGDVRAQIKMALVDSSSSGVEQSIQTLNAGQL